MVQLDTGKGLVQSDNRRGLIRSNNERELVQPDFGRGLVKSDYESGLVQLGYEKSTSTLLLPHAKSIYTYVLQMISLIIIRNNTKLFNISTDTHFYPAIRLFTS